MRAQSRQARVPGRAGSEPANWSQWVGILYTVFPPRPCQCPSIVPSGDQESLCKFHGTCSVISTAKFTRGWNDIRSFFLQTIQNPRKFINYTKIGGARSAHPIVVQCAWIPRICKLCNKKKRTILFPCVNFTVESIFHGRSPLRGRLRSKTCVTARLTRHFAHCLWNDADIVW